MQSTSLKVCVCVLMVVSFFFALGCKRNESKSYSDIPELSPLGNAARHQDIARLNLLLANGVDVNAQEKQGETAIYDALECPEPNCDNVPIVDALLDHGAVINANLPWWGTPLTYSLTRDYGNPKASMELIRRGSLVSKICNGEDTDLSLATQNFELDVMRALLENGADPNCANKRRANALYWAAINGEASAVELLLKFGANPNGPDGRPVIDVAKTTNPDRDVQKRFQETRNVFAKFAEKNASATR